MNFSYSPLLRDFTKATNIRLRFLRTNTLLGHLMGKALRDPTVTRRVRGRAGPLRECAGPGEGTGDDPPATPVRQEVALFFVELGIGLLAEAWSQQDPCQTCGCEELVQVSEVRRSSDP